MCIECGCGWKRLSGSLLLDDWPALFTSEAPAASRRFQQLVVDRQPWRQLGIPGEGEWGNEGCTGCKFKSR